LKEISISNSEAFLKKKKKKKNRINFSYSSNEGKNCNKRTQWCVEFLLIENLRCRDAKTNTEIEEQKGNTMHLSIQRHSVE
jgi:hypothetical protein